MSYRSSKPRKSAAQQHKEFLDRMGLASLAGCALAFAGMLYGAYKADEANGITVSQSLASWGIGSASVPQGRGWRIVQYYKGEAFVIDHGLTHDDCDDMLPRNQAAKGLSFACELGA